MPYVKLYKAVLLIIQLGEYAEFLAIFGGNNCATVCIHA